MFFKKYTFLIKQYAWKAKFSFFSLRWNKYYIYGYIANCKKMYLAFGLWLLDKIKSKSENQKIEIHVIFGYRQCFCILYGFSSSSLSKKVFFYNRIYRHISIKKCVFFLYNRCTKRLCGYMSREFGAYSDIPCQNCSSFYVEQVKFVSVSVILPQK